MSSRGDSIWVGVDVGGEKKGFHIAALDVCGSAVGPLNVKSVSAVVARLLDLDPIVIAIDSPCCAAASGAKSRDCERKVARNVCGIRYTPDAATVNGGRSYYEWIRNGFALYEALAARKERGWTLIEVFPTASWTRLYAPRGSLTRAAWSRAALDSLAVTGLPVRRLNQDDRDAVVAAWTARLWSETAGLEWFGEIAIPRAADRLP